MQERKRRKYLNFLTFLLPQTSCRIKSNSTTGMPRVYLFADPNRVKHNFTRYKARFDYTTFRYWSGYVHIYVVPLRCWIKDIPKFQHFLIFVTLLNANGVRKRIKIIKCWDFGIFFVIHLWQYMNILPLLDRLLNVTKPMGYGVNWA